MLINCDIGERGSDHPVDNALMDYIHLANIACGGHAGDSESVGHFCQLANEKGVLVAAHLSYPDRENFGRKELMIPFSQLEESLNTQYTLISQVKRVKLHGALYNSSVIQADLAENIATWFQSVSINEVITSPGSALSQSCLRREIKVLNEAFAERTYTWDHKRNTLILTPRDNPQAHIKSVEEAFEQYLYIKNNSKVLSWDKKEYSLSAETICIHSDSSIALELAKKLHFHEQSL